MAPWMSYRGEIIEENSLKQKGKKIFNLFKSSI